MSAYRPRQPAFFWQGVLIALPAVVLAAISIAAIRQDRLLVRQQATEEARRIARQAAQLLNWEFEHPGLPTNGPSLANSDRPFQANDDLVLHSSEQAPGWVLCLVDTNGSLIYPAPEDSLVPNPATPLPGLTPEQQTSWAAAIDAGASSSNWERILQAYTSVLGKDPPEQFAAKAHFHLAVLALRSGRTTDAREEFQRVRRDYSSVPSDTGVPLSLYASLHLLCLPTEAQLSAQERSDLLQSTCATAVLQFPNLAGAILDRLEAAGGMTTAQTEPWRKVLEAHGKSRRLHLSWKEAVHHVPGAAIAAPKWIGMGSAAELWLVRPAGTPAGVWLMALPESRAAEWIQSVLRQLNLPPHFAWEVRLDGKFLGDDEGEVLAEAPTQAASGEVTAVACVRLARPELLFERQEVRTYWLASAVAMAGLTMAAGFYTARRAFLRQRELNELRSNFVSSVSHELRAPIASVRLMAEELVDAPDGPSDTRRNYHQFIAQECRRLSALIENVLDFSRHEQGRRQYQFEPTDLSSLVENTAQLMRVYAAEKEIDIVVTKSVAEMEMEADGRALQQVLVNLIDNSIKHSPNASTIRVGLEAQLTADDGHESSAWWKAGLLRGGHGERTENPNQTVRLWVEDQGEGIPLGEQKRIFERFYRPGSELRRETQGVGLGLAIVKYVAEAHGGRVTVRSEPGKGSRFTVHLPVRRTCRRRTET